MRVRAVAAKQARRNSGWAIQKIGWRSSRTSRTVPPPRAVTTAITTTPSQSRLLRPAASAPLMANTATPTTSRTWRMCRSLPSQPGLHTALQRGGVVRVAPIEDLSDFLQNLVSSVWLGEEGDVRPFHSVVDQHLGGMSRHIKDALVGPLLRDELAKLDAVTVRHDHVHDQQIDVTARLTQNRKGFFGVLRFQNAVALLTQDSVRNPTR